MDFRVHLDPGLEAEVRERAAASGKDVATYVADALREKIENEPGVEGESVGLSFETWSRELDEWVELPRNPGPVVDDSRESIYGDRGL